MASFRRTTERASHRGAQPTLLVACTDCKGFPFVKFYAAKVTAFESPMKNPGDRLLVTVATADEVETYVGTTEEHVPPV